MKINTGLYCPEYKPAGWFWFCAIKKEEFFLLASRLTLFPLANGHQQQKNASRKFLWRGVKKTPLDRRTFDNKLTGGGEASAQ